MRERYLIHSGLVRVASLLPGTDVEVVVQSGGGSGRKQYVSRIEEVNETRQSGNEQVILVSRSGRTRYVGGGTSVRKI